MDFLPQTIERLLFGDNPPPRPLFGGTPNQPQPQPQPVSLQEALDRPESISFSDIPGLAAPGGPGSGDDAPEAPTKDQERIAEEPAAKGDRQPVTSAAAGKPDDEDRIERQIERLEGEGKDILKRKGAASEKAIADLQGDIDSMQAPPTLEKMPNAPQNNIAQGAMEWMQIATVLGALAGGRARGNTTAALNAFGGAIKGFTQGKKEEFNNNIEEWKVAAEKVKTDNQAKLDQYDLIFKNKKMSMDLKLGMLQIAAEQYKDEITYNLASQRNYTTLAEVNQREKQFQATHAERLISLQLQAERLQASINGTLSGRSQVQAALNMWMREYRAQNGHDPSAQEYEKKLIDLTRETAAGRAVGGYQARVSTFSNEFNRMYPTALTQIADYSQGKDNKFVPWNQLRQMSQRQLSNPQLASLKRSLDALRNSYIRTLNPTGQSRVADRIEARADAVLDAATGPASLVAQIKIMRQEITNTENALKDSVDSITDMQRYDPLEAQELVDEAWLKAQSGTKASRDKIPWEVIR